MNAKGMKMVTNENKYTKTITGPHKQRTRRKPTT